MLYKNFFAVGPLINENIKCILGIPSNLKKPTFYISNFDFIVNSIYSSPRDYIYKNKIENIQILKDINCTRGRKFKRGLPVRGQRTHKNAKTRRVRNIV